MNLNGLVNMVLRLLTRNAVSWGIRRLARGGAKPPGRRAGAQERKLRQGVSRARQAVRLTRGIGR